MGMYEKTTKNAIAGKHMSINVLQSHNLRRVLTLPGTNRLTNSPYETGFILKLYPVFAVSQMDFLRIPHKKFRIEKIPNFGQNSAEVFEIGFIM